MIKIVKHKGYACWQSPVTWICYFLDKDGVWISHLDDFYGETTKKFARGMIELILEQKRERGFIND